jgi:hypothetical protein
MGEVWAGEPIPMGDHTTRPFEVFSEKSKRCTVPVRKK